MEKATSAPPAPRPRGSPGPWERHPIFWLATVALLVTMFSRAQEVLIPLALGVLIAFALTPAVLTIERRLGRAISVAIVVALSLGLVVGFGVLVRRQLFDFSTQVVKYSESMRRKVIELRGDERAGLGGLSRAIDDVIRELDAKVAESREVTPVRIVPSDTTAVERVQESLEPVLKPVAKAVIVFVLVVFLLLKREDLRDRFVRLAGRRNLSLTTRTLDEAGRRIGRFLMTQAVINGGFGVVVALGLLVIGVPYAILWGFMAMLLRFVPVLGSVLAVVPPALLAFAQFDGWGHSLATLGLFIGLDLVVAYFVEPVAIGRSTGLSSLAMVLAAVFWTWLWGPVGLLLSTPLTLCLAVLGRQVPRLEFLAVLLGDEPALEKELTFYQRLLAHDEDEAGSIFDRQLQISSPLEMFDDLVVPTLLLAEADRARGAINDADHDEILRTLRALVASVRMENGRSPTGTGPIRAPRPYRVLGVPARNEAEALLWQMFGQLFDPVEVEVEGVGAEALASEVAAVALGEMPNVICITSVPPGGLAQVRYLCKRLAARRPGARIVVLRPSGGAEVQEAARSLTEYGATFVVATLSDARLRAEQLLHLASAEDVAPKAGGIALGK